MGGLKKRVAARRRGNHIGQPPVVNHDRIQVPEIESRQIAGQNLLRLHVIGAPLCRVRIRGSVVKQRIEPRIRVVSPIGAFGRKVRRLNA